MFVDDSYYELNLNERQRLYNPVMHRNNSKIECYYFFIDFVYSDNSISPIFLFIYDVF